jgi:hypothetical protein
MSKYEGASASSRDSPGRPPPDTRPLVGVGRDVLPVALSGELGSELAYLSVQPAAACTTGGFSGVDGNSPHGVSSLARCHW